MDAVRTAVPSGVVAVATVSRFDVIHAQAGPDTNTYHSRAPSRGSAAGHAGPIAGANPAHVDPTPRATARMSPSTALLVAAPPAPGPPSRTVPTGSPEISMRFITPAVSPSGLLAGTAVGTTAAATTASSRSATARSLIARPSDAAPRSSGPVTPVMPGGASPRAAGGRRPTVVGSSHVPNARRARMTSLFTASSPSTSPLGSASAYPLAWASERTSPYGRPSWLIAVRM